MKYKIFIIIISAFLALNVSAQRKIKVEKEKKENTTQTQTQTQSTTKTQNSAKEQSGRKGNTRKSNTNSSSTKTSQSKSSSSSTGGNPSKKVLYSLGAAEQLIEGEFSSNMKTNGTKFLCVVEDKVSKRQTLVLDGNKVITADYVWVYDVDLDKPNNLSYVYRNGKDWYLVSNGTKNGPYDEISTPQAPMTKLYNFKRMGKYFRHDSDGTIYPYEGTSVWRAEDSDPVYKSNNGKHRLQFSNYKRNINFDGTYYTVPMSKSFSRDDLDHLAISDDGLAMIHTSYDTDNGWDHHYIMMTAGPNGSAREVSSDEFWQLYREFFGGQNGLPSGSFEPNYENLESYKKGDKWFSGLNIMLQDKSNRHILNAHWDYDYVMVDDKQIKCSAPFYAFYDENTDSFGWVSQEGKQFVLYTYKL